MQQPNPNTLASIDAYLEGLKDKKPPPDYQVICDSSNNPPEAAEANTLYVDFIVSPPALQRLYDDGYTIEGDRIMHKDESTLVQQWNQQEQPAELMVDGQVLVPSDAVIVDVTLTESGELEEQTRQELQQVHEQIAKSDKVLGTTTGELLTPENLTVVGEGVFLNGISVGSFVNGKVTLNDLGMSMIRSFKLKDVEKAIHKKAQKVSLQRQARLRNKIKMAQQSRKRNRT